MSSRTHGAPVGPGPRLATIPGISPHLAESILAETGTDMTTFPTPAHLKAAPRPPTTASSRQTRRRA
ncbi:transposase [Agromyces bauzanensis]|uniref:transposase n=1 Tax=Agromyces bauzanensis TaxID=1308924 RepID=UPI0016691F39|nr:transposase [Agromyces bauzanensis]